jgi:hypothetical protein
MCCGWPGRRETIIPGRGSRVAAELAGALRVPIWYLFRRVRGAQGFAGVFG